MLPTGRSPWEEILRAASARDHLVQLYEHDGFLARVVTRFLAAGLRGGEAAVVIATPEHADRFGPGLSGMGLDVAALRAAGQLVVLDAAATLAEIASGDTPDGAAFTRLLTETLARVRAAGFSGVRLFGEMVELLRARRLDAALELEALWNDLLAEQEVSLLCAYRIDNFSRDAHRRGLGAITRAHSHLIPVEDYARLERAVERAYADVFGASGDGAALHASLVARPGVGRTSMPAGEEALLALRDLSPTLADQVLERARDHYHAG